MRRVTGPGWRPRRSAAAALGVLTATTLTAGVVAWRANAAPATRDQLAHQLTRERRLHAREVQALRATWRPTVEHAITLAAAVTGVPRRTLHTVAWCESRLNPTARNRQSTATGLYQFLNWGSTALGRAGFSATDPYAQAVQAAWWIQSRGLRPWAASRSCWGR